MEELTAFPTRTHGKINIPEQIGVKYKDFGIQLLEDSTGARVSNIEHELRGNPKSINTQIFEVWLRNGYGKKPVSWRTLVEVLRDIQLGTLANDIEEACLQQGKTTTNNNNNKIVSGLQTLSRNSWQNKKALFGVAVVVIAILIGNSLIGNSLIGNSLIGASTGNGVTQPSIAPRSAKVVMDKDQSIENLAPGVAISTTMQPSPILEFAKVLNDTYQKQPVTDPSQWLQVPGVVMPFIDLTLTDENKTAMQRSIEKQYRCTYELSLDEVVNSVKKGSKILIKGEPGIGKTTILRHIAKQWAEGKLLQRFQLVILIQLGHIPSSRISNLESLLEYHSHDYPDTASVARELGRTGGEGICFLLDALDEYSPQTLTHSDYIYKLIRGDRLPNAALMVTSRPSASYRWQQEFQRKIVVVGFVRNQIQQYINALPASTATTLSECINRYQNVKRISYLPLHLAMMTYLALHSEKVSLLDLDTETRIYHMFVNLTFRQRHKESENLDEVHSQAFSALSKAAFDATTKHSDSKTSLRLHHLNPELRAKVESFSILTIYKRHEGDTIGERFTFSHYTFQEFFAAYYLTTLPHEEQMQALKIYHCTSPLMWRFFFGLLRAHSSKNTTKLFETFAHIHRMNDTLTMKCAYELKQTSIAEVLFQTLSHTIEIKAEPQECEALGYVLSLNPFQFRGIALTAYSEDNWEACFVSMLAELPVSNGVEDVILRILTISNRAISFLAQFVQRFPNLQDLRMFITFEHMTENNIVKKTNYDLSYTETVMFAAELEKLKHLRQLLFAIYSLDHQQGYPEMKFVATVLTHLQYLTSLQKLALRWDTIGYDEVVALNEGFKRLTSLKELLVLHSVIRGRSAAKLSEGINHLTSLEALELSENDKSDVAALAGGLKNLTSLKTLDLSHNKIGDRGAAKLAEGIKHLTSLETLNLTRNSIGYKGVVALTEGIKNLTSLKTLDLYHNEIGDKGAAKLTEGMKHLTSLETLNMSWNRMGDDGVVALAEGLKYLTSLKILDLSSNEVGDRALEKLNEETNNLSSLESIYLSYKELRAACSAPVRLWSLLKPHPCYRDEGH